MLKEKGSSKSTEREEKQVHFRTDLLACGVVKSLQVHGSHSELFYSAIVLSFFKKSCSDLFLLLYTRLRAF